MLGAKYTKSRIPSCVQYLARITLSLCFIVMYSAQPGVAQTSPVTTPNSPITSATNLSAQRVPPPGAESSPVPATTPFIPPITPETNPNVISPPQAQLDYNLQIPLFGELPLRKELSEKGIDSLHTTLAIPRPIRPASTVQVRPMRSRSTLASASISTSWGFGRMPSRISP